MPTMTELSKIEKALGKQASYFLEHQSKGFPKEHLHLPGPDFVDRIGMISDRSPRVLQSLQTLFNTGRLANTGYLSILPVDQGIEHSGGASFAKNPIYFDGENIVKLAIEGGCNAVASTFGVLGSVARKYAHKIPFIVKLNHNEFLSYPNGYDQIMFGSVKQAWDMGAVAVGAGAAAIGSFKHEPLIEEMDDFAEEGMEDLDEEAVPAKADGWEDAEEKEDEPFEKLEDDDDEDSEEDEMDGDDEGYF